MKGEQNLKNLVARDIKNIRKKFNISQERLASLLGVSWVTVSRWERNINHISDKESKIIGRISKILEISNNRMTHIELIRVFISPHPDLYGDCPSDAISTELGYRAVRNILEGLLIRKYT